MPASPGLDVSALRAVTPGCAHGVHLNSAGAALMSRGVLDTVTSALETEARLGGYAAAAAFGAEVDATRGLVAQLIGARADEVALTDNATRGFNAVLLGLGLGPGDRIVTCRTEYCSSFMSYLALKGRRRVVVDVAPDDRDGQVDVAALEGLITDRTRLVALPHVPTSGSVVQPVAEIGSIARAAGVPFLLDAAQSAGQIPLDVGRIGCDFLTASGRKFLRGPRGTGFLFVREPWLDGLEPMALDLGGASWEAADRYRLRPGARRFEPFESSTALRLGLGQAVREALGHGVAALQTRIRALAQRLREALAAIPGVVVRDRGRERCGIVTFTVDGVAGQDVRALLADDGFDVGLSVAESTRLDFDARGLDSVVRASVHAYNTEGELDMLCTTVASIADRRVVAR